MLFSIDGGGRPKPITRLPHEKDFKTWRGRLTDAEYQAIVGELRHRIEGGEVHTSSWLPGANWEGTVFQPIFETACLRNRDTSSLFFGLIVWKMFMDHEDNWSFGRYEKDEMRTTLSRASGTGMIGVSSMPARSLTTGRLWATAEGVLPRIIPST